MACRSEASKCEVQDLNRDALRGAGVHPADTRLTGAGVVICVIDYGFDLCHPALRTPAGETRFAALIDQNGSRLERAAINRQQVGGKQLLRCAVLWRRVALSRQVFALPLGMSPSTPPMIRSGKGCVTF